MEQSLIKTEVLKFHFISFLPVSSQGHFKVVSMNSKVRFSHPDLTRGFYQYEKRTAGLGSILCSYFLINELSVSITWLYNLQSEIKKEVCELDDILLTIPLQVEIFSLPFIGGNLCQKL